jgi:hypothetical protein
MPRPIQAKGSGDMVSKGDNGNGFTRIDLDEVVIDDDDDDIVPHTISEKDWAGPVLCGESVYGSVDTLIKNRGRKCWRNGAGPVVYCAEHVKGEEFFSARVVERFLCKAEKRANAVFDDALDDDAGSALHELLIAWFDREVARYSYRPTGDIVIIASA